MLTNLTNLTFLTIFRMWRHAMVVMKGPSSRSRKQRFKQGIIFGPTSRGAGDWRSSHTTKIPKTAATKILSGFSRAVQQAGRSGKNFQMIVEIEPHSMVPRISIEELSPGTDDDLDTALAAAKTRGAARVADILKGDDMLTADAFAKEIGATRETVHKKRHRHEVLGLEGPKRGVRFPKWQLSGSGDLLPNLPLLFQAVGGHPWTVYRFLLQKHPELDGIRALDALRQGRIEDVIAVAGMASTGSFA